jgi:hypothetical protein
VYLRGRPATVVVDVNRARLAGKRDSLPPAARAPVSPGTGPAPAQRFAHATGLIAGDPQAAIDSLMLLRIDMLDVSPAGAGALSEVVGALRAGRDIAGAVARARAVLAGEPRTDDPTRLWGGGW